MPKHVFKKLHRELKISFDNNNNNNNNNNDTDINKINSNNKLYSVVFRINSNLTCLVKKKKKKKIRNHKSSQIPLSCTKILKKMKILKKYRRILKKIQINTNSQAHCTNIFGPKHER